MSKFVNVLVKVVKGAYKSLPADTKNYPRSNYPKIDLLNWDNWDNEIERAAIY